MLTAVIAAAIIIISFRISQIASDELLEKRDFPIDNSKR